MVKPVREARWREAQQHELDFWKHWRTLPPYRNLDLERYWAGERARFGLPDDFFKGKGVLDVGCGPVGLIHFLPEAGWRIRLDPLLLQYTEKLPLAEPGMSVVATGERLPLASGSVDVAICFNALDHMQDPHAALADLARSLRAGGTLLLMTHTFPGWTMPLLAGDRLHPHHWTRQGLLGQVGRCFRLVHTATVRRKFDLPFRDCVRPSYWKYLAASFVLSTTYVLAAREKTSQLDTAP